MIYIVYAPSKSGTTSLFKALTDNKCFPAIQTHDDFTDIGIHDASAETEFVRYIRMHFAPFLKSPTEFDENITWQTDHYSCALFFDTHEIQRLKFIEYIKRHDVKFITPLRNPISRSISAMIHWLDIKAIEALYQRKLRRSLDLNNIQAHDLIKLNHMPIEMILSRYSVNKTLSNKDVCDIYNSIFHDDLYREYTNVFYNLKKHFNFNINLEHKLHQCISQSQHSLFVYRLEDLTSIIPVLYEYVNIGDTYEFPHERNKHKRPQYIYKGNINELSEFIKYKSCISNFSMATI